MKLHPLNRVSILASILAVTAATNAVAAPVIARYTGTVDGVSGGSAQALADHPLGTAVSWEFSFDDAFTSVRPSSGNIFAAASQPVVGSLRIAGDAYALNFARLSSYAQDPILDEVSSYMFQVEGTGPVTAGDGDFWGLWFRFDPMLNLLSAQVGFGYDFPNGTGYSYLSTTGNYRIDPRNAVPVPGTVWLMLPALAWLVRRPRLPGRAAAVA
jgi:hypothetical protein